MEFRVAATGAVNPGKNLATGTLHKIPRPITSTGIRAVRFQPDYFVTNRVIYEFRRGLQFYQILIYVPLIELFF